MKNICIIVSLSILPVSAFGQTIFDDFEDGILGADFTLNPAGGDTVNKIAEANGTLEYTDPNGILGLNFQYVSQNLLAPVGLDWSVSVELTNTHSLAFFAGFALMGIEIYNTGDPNFPANPAVSDYFNTRLVTYDFDGVNAFVPVLDVLSGLFTDGFSTGFGFSLTPTPTGTLEIAYDASAQSFTSIWNGTAIDTFSVVGWNLAPDGFFEINLYGQSNVPTLAGEISADNYTYTVVPEPSALALLASGALSLLVLFRRRTC